MGTSITQRAVRMLASAGVIIGFCGTGGTPLLAGTEMDLVWMYPQSEYRITKFIQGWQHFWYDDAKRLEAAKIFQRERIAYLQTVWSRDADLLAYGFDPESGDISDACRCFHASIDSVDNVTDLLTSLTSSKIFWCCRSHSSEHLKGCPDRNSARIRSSAFWIMMRSVIFSMLLNPLP